MLATTRLRLPALLVAALLMLLVVAGWGNRAHATRYHRSARAAAAVSLKTFAGTWMGHTRALVISATGAATEQLGDGCCDQVLTMKFQLSDPSGTPSNASALGRVTSIQHLNAKDYAGDPKNHVPASPKPYVGKTARIRLKNGVLTETLDGFNVIYCDDKAEAKGTCGA